MTPTREQMELAKGVIENWQDVGLTIPVNKERDEALQTALTALDALLNAGEVFGESLGKADEDIPDDKEEAYRLGSKDTRSEDTAILARKIMGLEEVIYKARQEWEKLCGEWSEDKPRPMPFDKYLTQIITQHLKGAK